MTTLIKKLEFHDKIYIYLDTEDILTIPYNYTRRIQAAKKEELRDYRLIGGGKGVHFESIDEDISLNGIIAYKFKGDLKAS
jgi:hypothetical protein